MFKLVILGGILLFGWFVRTEWKKYKSLFEADEKLGEQEVENAALNKDGLTSLQREENEALKKELNNRGNDR